MSIPDGGVTIGLDAGTSGLKAVALDAAGHTVAEATRTYPLLTPQPGWTEQDPNAWWAAACEAIAELLTHVPAERVLAVAASGQMHGMVPLDDAGDPVRNALLWNDQRTGAEVERIQAAIPHDELVARTGNPAITGFQLPKVLWLQRHEPDAYARTRRILFPKDFLTFGLTGTARTEPTDATGAGALAITTGDWDTALLGDLGIDPALFPPLIASDALVGVVTPEASAATGLPAGIPVVAGAGDNAAASIALGLGSADETLGSVSLGTSGVLFAPRTEPIPDPLGRVHLFAHADGTWMALGVTLAAAGSLAWWLRMIDAEAEVAERVDRALARPVGAGGVTFTPFLAGERSPFLHPDLRGGFSGLSLATEPDDLTRAVLEGVAFSLRDVFDVMRPLGVPERLLATGGGSRGEAWVQLLADTLDTPIGIPAHIPGASHGAAVLAWRHLGVEVPKPAVQRWIEPHPSEQLEAAYARYREVAPRLEADA